MRISENERDTWQKRMNYEAFLQDVMKEAVFVVFESDSLRRQIKVSYNILWKHDILFHDEVNCDEFHLHWNWNKRRFLGWKFSFNWFINWKGDTMRSLKWNYDKNNGGWMNNEKCPQVTAIRLRFNSRRNDWQCSQYLTLNPTCAWEWSNTMLI